MRRLMMWAAVGGLAGGTIATLVAPWVLQTFLSSTGAKDAMCQCSELVANTASLLIKTQLWGALVGAVLFPGGAVLTKRLWGKRGQLSGPTSTDAGPTPSGQPH